MSRGYASYFSQFAQRSETLFIATCFYLHKIDTTSYANSNKGTWIVRLLGFYIAKGRFPTAIGKADGVPQFPSISGIEDISSRNDLEVVTVSCTIDGVEGTWIVRLLGFYIAKGRLPTTLAKRMVCHSFPSLVTPVT